MNSADELLDMGKFFRDCDYLTGENHEGIRYESCVECYRLDICEKYFKRRKESEGVENGD